MISFRRTLHSSRRLAHEMPRARKYTAPATIATDATVSITSTIDGGTMTTLNAKTAIFTATPAAIARPGKVLNSVRFIRRQSLHCLLYTSDAADERSSV